jgi:hypothetical protein
MGGLLLITNLSNITRLHLKKKERKEGGRERGR